MATKFDSRESSEERREASDRESREERREAIRENILAFFNEKFRGTKPLWLKDILELFEQLLASGANDWVKNWAVIHEMCWCLPSKYIFDDYDKVTDHILHTYPDEGMAAFLSCNCDDPVFSCNCDDPDEFPKGTRMKILRCLSSTEDLQLVYLYHRMFLE